MSKFLALGTAMAASLITSGTISDNQVTSTAPMVQSHPYLVPGDDSLLAKNEFSSSRSVETVITAYSSEEGQTDDTPFITASGKNVRPGIVAANWLPLGTKVRIVDLTTGNSINYQGNSVFTVEDRMAPKNDGKLDIWFQTREEAVKFGLRKARIEVL